MKRMIFETLIRQVNDLVEESPDITILQLSEITNEPLRRVMDALDASVLIKGGTTIVTDSPEED